MTIHVTHDAFTSTACGECGQECDTDVCRACARELAPIVAAARGLIETVYCPDGSGCNGEVTLESYGDGAEAWEATACVRGLKVSERLHSYGATPRKAYTALIDSLTEEADALVVSLLESVRAAKAVTL